MKALKTTLSLALTLMAPLSFSFAGGGKAIYGDDDRLDLFAAPPELRLLADSVVSLWKMKDIEPADRGMRKLKTQKFGDKNGLCPDEKFREQPVGAFCSGSLVGDDLVITAGHCIIDEAECRRTGIVFGYAVKEDGGKASVVMPEKEVYGCAKILKRFLYGESRVDTPPDRLYGADFALIRLNRKVTGHTPLEVDMGAGLRKGDGILVMGYPKGLPLKIAGGATVQDFNADGDTDQLAPVLSYFTADLDIFRGNSGGPVFNAGTGLIEGIVARKHDEDFTKTPAGCYTSSVYKQNSGGNDITKISVLTNLLLELRGSASGKAAGNSVE
ncbi:MAG: serine protease [Elusimicrobiales bacterium]|jgi:V8-like Glu-specific endopeptidase